MSPDGCRQGDLLIELRHLGVPAVLPIDEATPQAPINPYGKTKLVAEHMLADYAAAFR